MRQAVCRTCAEPLDPGSAAVDKCDDCNPYVFFYLYADVTRIYRRDLGEGGMIDDYTDITKGECSKGFNTHGEVNVLLNTVTHGNGEYPIVFNGYSLAQDAEQLRKAHGGHWESHPDYAIEDWRYEIANDDTRLGYWEWVAAGIDGSDN